MPSLKTLKNRIKSIKSTKKITKAMKLISVSRLTKARERVSNTALYNEKIQGICKNLVDLSIDGQISDLPLISSMSKDSTLVLIVTSNRGVCGAFNSSVVKAADRYLQTLKKDGKNFQIICIGKKGQDLLKYNYGNFILDAIHDKEINFIKAENIITNILELFKEGKFDNCIVFYNKFISMLKYETTFDRLLPILDIAAKTSDVERIPKKANSSPYDYEPNIASLIKDVLPKSLAAKLYFIILQSMLSEHSARMLSMENATKNSEDILKKLSITYNKVRQAIITKELIEIISGLEAI